MFSDLLAQATASPKAGSSSLKGKQQTDGNGLTARSAGASRSTTGAKTAAGQKPLGDSSRNVAGQATTAAGAGKSSSSSTLSKDRANKIAMLEKLKAQRGGGSAGSSGSSSGSGSGSSAKVAASSSSSSSKPSASSSTAAAPARKKPNFLDILKAAETVSSEKMKVGVKVKDPKKKAATTSRFSGKLGRSSQSPAPAPAPATSRSTNSPVKPARDAKTVSSERKAVSGGARENVKSSKPMKLDRKDVKMSGKSAVKAGVREKPESAASASKHQPAPFAKPMAGLLKKRKAHYDSDSSLDDFIVDDEDEEEEERGYSKRRGDPGYDREEIWSLFSRGRPRPRFNDYDEDDDDMEVSGLEVLKEEQRSALAAKRDDEREAEEERRRAEEKRKRLKRA
ncbi:SPT2 chromatin protein-domain-containing protein [Myxozyma melibiosi]|uniref:SPT2 chromatin protein-domain-containing protein n=1 Tax=Myxozyma melibiosi TaxID=54550 RepID=A0ABR1F4F1_9ASCO